MADDPVLGEPVSGRNLPALRKMQGEFEKMQRDANCNRAKSVHFAMVCTRLSLLKEQGDSHCLSRDIEEIENRRITAKIK